VTREATQSNPLYCLRVEAAPAATFSPTLEVDRVRSSFFSPRVRRTEDRKAFPSATRCRMCRRNLGNGGTRLEPVLRTKYVIQCGRPANVRLQLGSRPEQGQLLQHFWRPSSDGNSPYIWRRIAVYVDVVEYRLDRRLPEYFVRRGTMYGEFR